MNFQKLSINQIFCYINLELEEIYQAPPCLGGRARELMKEEEAEKSRVEKK